MSTQGEPGDVRQVVENPWPHQCRSCGGFGGHESGCPGYGASNAAEVERLRLRVERVATWLGEALRFMSRLDLDTGVRLSIKELRDAIAEDALASQPSDVDRQLAVETQMRKKADALLMAIAEVLAGDEPNIVTETVQNVIDLKERAEKAEAELERLRTLLRASANATGEQLGEWEELPTVIERQRVELADVTRERDAYIELEGRLCPEDVGFEELIGVLRKKLASPSAPSGWQPHLTVADLYVEPEDRTSVIESHDVHFTMGDISLLVNVQGGAGFSWALNSRDGKTNEHGSKNTDKDGAYRAPSGWQQRISAVRHGLKEVMHHADDEAGFMEPVRQAWYALHELEASLGQHAKDALPPAPEGSPVDKR